MKALAVNGSPRQNGNTALLLQTVLNELSARGIETELFQLEGHPVSGCRACMGCRQRQNRRCVIEQDIINECIAKMVAADAIIIGSPTYFANVTTEIKALMDRAGYVAMANGRMLARKIGAAVVVHRRGGAVPVFDALNRFFLISGMIVPGSTYWNFAVGRNPGEVAEDVEGLANMRHLAETVAWLLECTRNQR